MDKFDNKHQDLTTGIFCTCIIFSNHYWTVYLYISDAWNVILIIGLVIRHLVLFNKKKSWQQTAGSHLSKKLMLKIYTYVKTLVIISESKQTLLTVKLELIKNSEHRLTLSKPPCLLVVFVLNIQLQQNICTSMSNVDKI